MSNLKSFDELKNGDKIISPIDKEVTAFLIDNEGEKYLANKTSMYPYVQFDPRDFYIYDGVKEVGEVDEEYFKEEGLQ
jgi:hypothetical protein